MRFDRMPPLTVEQRRTVEVNMGLVGFVLRRRAGEDDYDDAFQDGVLGLMRATQMFDPARGIRFSTYAVGWIRAGIQHGLLNLEGVNFRRARTNGVPFVGTLSLDTTIDDSDFSFTNVVASSEPPPDVVGVDRAALCEARRYAESVCRDDLDRRIVAALFDGGHANNSRVDSAVAEATGVSKQAIWMRRKRLQGLLRARSEVAA